jgi:A/G-specific adenine glycosylase
MIFSNRLIQWYLIHKRDLPWRNTNDPYLIWLSEIMLQQTRVAQGLPYFLSFVNAFPKIQDLASASEEEVLKLWQGLGYYSRARNLHATAKIVTFVHNGSFPNNYKDLILLKGVGAYTAAAIASFAFDEAVPVVDGNVYRVLSRFFDVKTDIASHKAVSEFKLLAETLMPKENPALFNQAIMEFGALQCVPKNPNCEQCIFNDSCLAYKNNEVSLLPIKTKKNKPIDRYFNYFILKDPQGHSLVQKRTQGIWKNLYEFPLLETLLEATSTEIDNFLFNLLDPNIEISLMRLHQMPILHKLTHQNLHINFWKVDVHQNITEGMPLELILEKPLPIVINNFIEKNFQYL